MLWRFITTTVRHYVASLKARPAPEQPYLLEAEAGCRSAPYRAEKLLLDYLTPVQRETYRRYGWFVVRGQSGRRYAIWKKDFPFSNVCELGGYGQTVSRLCAQAAINIPRGDHLLTQKLMLEHHEAEFRRVASRTRFQN